MHAYVCMHMYKQNACVLVRAQVCTCDHPPSTHPPIHPLRAHAHMQARAQVRGIRCCKSKPLDPMAGYPEAISPGRPSSFVHSGPGLYKWIPTRVARTHATLIPEPQAPSVKHRLPPAVPDFDSQHLPPHLHTCPHTHSACTHPPTHAHLHPHLLHACACMHVYACICMHAYVCTHM